MRDALTAESWPSPVFADSGNGGHLMYRVDLPADDNGLVKRCLEALDTRFGDDAVHVDKGVFNPARVWKLYGTLARKGEDLPDRPHRLAWIIEKPDVLEVVSTELLEALAGSGKSAEEPAQRRTRAGFDLEQWIETHLPGTRHKRTTYGDVWIIPVCPFNAEHNRGEAFVRRGPDDIIGAGCKHDSCAWGWHELREKFEPGCYDKTTEQRKSRQTVEYQTDGPQDFPLTDLGNAERLISAHGENLRFDVNRKQWLVWNGKRWEYDETSRVDRMAMRVVRSMYKLLPSMDRDPGDKLLRHIKTSESAPRLAGMLSLAAKLSGVPVRESDLDQDPWLFNVLNGTLDLRTGTLRTHAREDLITNLSETEYDANAVCPRWERFLQEIFQNDVDIMGFVKRMAGYMLTGDTREECLFVLVGKGQNGKGKLIEPMRKVLGSYAGDTPTTTLTEKTDSNSFELAGLVGKRMVTASESGHRQRFDMPLLKKLTGRDPVTTCFKFKDHFTYVPTYKLVFATNEVPHVDGQCYADRRRFRLIPFGQRFWEACENKLPVKDDQLDKKLLAEKNGILRWMVEGCLDWQRQGLDSPPIIREEVDQLFDSQDPLSEFLDEQCDIEPRAVILVNDLWTAYILWCDETKRDKAFRSSNWFSKSLTQRDGIDRQKNAGGRFLTGIRLKHDANDANAVFSETFSHEGEDMTRIPNESELRHCVTDPTSDGTLLDPWSDSEEDGEAF